MFLWLLFNSENHVNKSLALSGYISVNITSLLLFLLFCFPPEFKFALDGFSRKFTFSSWVSIIWHRSINSDSWRKIYLPMFSLFRTKICLLYALCLLGNVESLVTQNQLYTRPLPTTGFCLYVPITRKIWTHERQDSLNFLAWIHLISSYCK